MSKIWFYTEFNEDGSTIDLISIALVHEDGREYYALNNQYDILSAYKNDWLAKNVLAYLPPSGPLWKPRKQIAAEIVAFVGESPEFWSDYASYDWVALCQLYGRMSDLPKGWPMFVRDIQNLKQFVGFEGPLLEPENEHDALSDARNVRDRWRFLEDIRTNQGSAPKSLSECIADIHTSVPKFKGFA